MSEVEPVVPEMKDGDSRVVIAVLSEYAREYKSVSVGLRRRFGVGRSFREGWRCS